MRHSTEYKTRKVTPPSPSYMTNGQFASYLDNLRANRVSRPGGARAQPPSSRPLADRSSVNHHSVDGHSSPPSRDATSPPKVQKPFPHSPSIGVPSIASRNSARSTRSHDYYPSKPTKPLFKPSEVVPTTTYIERGQRWMEKEEAYSLRDAMDEMNLRDHPDSSPANGDGNASNHIRSDLPDDETRIYNAALDEASELVWQHQNGVVPRRPDGPYRYRPHLRKDSYAHARAASVTRGEGFRGEEDRGGRGSAIGHHSTPTPGYSSDEDHAARWCRMSSDTHLEDQGSKGKSNGNDGARASVRPRGSGKRDISGEVRRPFSGDQIWQEPQATPSKRASSVIANRYPPVSLVPKSSNSVTGRIQSIQQQQTPDKRLDRVEIHRNPPSRSRNAQYTVNTPQSHDPLPEGSHKSGIEIRSDDIRQATSMKLKDRSPNLPEPTAVSDSPGRPIVSFDTNWKSPEESTDVSPDRPSPTKSSDSQTMDIPAIVVAEDSSSRSRSRANANANVPSISVEDEEEQTQAKSRINVPTISVDDESPTRRDRPSISLPQDSPSKNARPLPTPAGRSAPGRGLPRPPPSHWSPAHNAHSRSATVCHECSYPIEGKFVALAGATQRFHPHCFRCYCCGISLEAMEISPEPEDARSKRIERIQRRATGEILDETPGQTMAEDGDDRLRFYCHLDWHELFAPRCKHCKTPIMEEHIVALGAHWHFGHFFCAECGDPFEQGMTHIEKDGYAWCVNCQTKRTERRAPKCKMCKTAVIGQYIKALGGEWHEHCFRCAECKGSFDDGQIFPKEIEGGSIVLCTQCRARELKY